MRFFSRWINFKLRLNFNNRNLSKMREKVENSFLDFLYFLSGGFCFYYYK